jgi:iron(III) transport system substrate-binding protein
MVQGSMTDVLKRLVIAAVVLGLAAGLVGQAGAQGAVQVSVYTALEVDQLQPYKTAFEQDTPGVTISWVRDSTGIITARLLAEKDNPRADVIWGLAASSMILFDDQNMLEPYTPKGAEQLKPSFRSSKNPLTWTGMDAWLAVVCFNTREALKRGLRQPASWRDLTNPAYKGQIVMPNPASSGTGYQAVAAWLQVMGEQEGWRFMDKLHENIAVYLHSGSAPCVQAARGEYAIGIGFDMRAATLKTQGAPIDIILPKDGVGWDMEATGIVRGTKNLAAAKRLADFAVTPKAYRLYNTFYALVGIPGVSSLPTNYPAKGESLMAKEDFNWMARNRDRILKEWSRRYDTKSAPR